MEILPHSSVYFLTIQVDWPSGSLPPGRTACLGKPQRAVRSSSPQPWSYLLATERWSPCISGRPGWPKGRWRTTRSPSQPIVQLLGDQQGHFTPGLAAWHFFICPSTTFGQSLPAVSPVNPLHPQHGSPCAEKSSADGLRLSSSPPRLLAEILQK